MKLSNRSVFAALALAALPLACSSARTRPNTAGNASGPVRVFTDSDFINDVASAEGSVYVATERGLLKYPATGGTPTRLTTRDGLPSDRLLAVAASDDGSAVWVATAQGVVRAGATGPFAVAGHPQAQPDVGRPTALLTTADGVILGGDHGLARFDGTSWSKLSDRYQVTELARGADDRVIVATAQTGLLVLTADLTALDEHNAASGIPEQLIRSVVSLPGGKIWALVQGPTGMQLAHFDGTRWFGYTTGEVARATWLAVVPSAMGVALVTQGGLFDIVLDRGEDLLPLGASPPGGIGHIELHPSV
ncbi:MAG: Hybrid sensor, partial [Myxococcaceae bacterium]|nr:Hybrid sensor [Myxococcaceae bacterium]